jgi:hypothetical protein
MEDQIEAAVWEHRKVAHIALDQSQGQVFPFGHFTVARQLAG